MNMTTVKKKNQGHPPGASVSLGGDAWTHPKLAGLLQPMESVEPWPGNPRRGDQERITSSIRDHGLYAGVVVQESSGRIVVGNHRRHALVALGATQLPVTPLAISDEDAAAIVVRDNRTSELGGYESAALLELLQQIEVDQRVPLEELGYDSAALSLLERQVEAESIMQVGAQHMLDEFREISGRDDEMEYDPGYIGWVRVAFKSSEALELLQEAVGLGKLSGLPEDERFRVLGWSLYRIGKKTNG